MGVVFLNPTSRTVVAKFPRSTNKGTRCCVDGSSWKNKNKNSTTTVCWQKNGSVTTSGGLWTKRLMLIPTTGKNIIERGRCVVNAGSMDLSSNKNPKNDLHVKDLVPCNTMMEGSEGIGIVKFLKGKRFFITSATGFLAKGSIYIYMGKGGKIFLLIKAQNKEAAMKRLKNEIINEELFKCLKQIHGKSYESFMLSKLVPVMGNVRESNIGMEEEDIAQLVAGEVDVIINSAGNTTFDERYDVALNINTRGVSRLMSFAKRSMAKHGGASGKPAGMNIYHVASSVVNPLVFEDLLRAFSYEHFSSSPFMDSKGRAIHVPRMKLFSSMDDFISHIWRDAIQRSKQLQMPASAADSNGKLTHKLEIACKKQVERLKHLAKIYEPYTFYGGRFDNTNTEKLMKELSEEERKSFGFDVRSIDWQHYITKIHIPGLRKHVMKGRGNAPNIKA